MSIKDLMTKKGWQGAGDLLVGSTTQDVTFQADFRERVGYYTVQFNLAIPNPDPNQLILPRAELTWSVEGGSFVRRLVNLGLGNAVSGTGQAVRVRMFDYSQLSVAGPVTYFVSAQVTPGTRPNGVHPPILTSRTLGTDGDARGQQASFGILAGGTATVQIPQGAGINSLIVNARTLNPADAPLTQNSLHFTIQGGTAILDGWNYDACGLWLPVAPSATDLFIENGSLVSVLITPTWAIEG